MSLASTLAVPVAVTPIVAYFGYRIITGAKLKKKLREIKEDKRCKRMTEVLHNLLYVGSVKNATDIEELKEHNINIVINVARECDYKESQLDGVTYYKFPMADDEDQLLADTMEQIIPLIDLAKLSHKRVLVHCRKGISRSVAVCIGYIIDTKKWSFDDTLAYIKNKRRIVNPNAGFRKQLQESSDIHLKGENGNFGLLS